MTTFSCLGSAGQIPDSNIFQSSRGSQIPRRCGRGHLDAAVQQNQRIGRSDTHASRAKTLIKICGVNSAEDAELAAAAGADFIGMIMWPKAKRSVATPVAHAIATVARQHGAQAVGVFVDEDAQTIEDRCHEAGIGVAQLHGDAAREALGSLPDTLQVIYVMHADSDGVIQTLQPAQLAASLGQDLSRPVEWVLVDGIVGGSGEKIDWGNLAPPKQIAQHGWFLAGGLGPHNVAEAVRQLHPTGVDVSSGVTGPDKLSKDPEKVHAFVSSVQSAIDTC